MKLTPHCPQLQQHIDHYWIVKDVATVFHQTPPVYAYPGITPELILVMGGYYTCHYQGKTEKNYHSKLYSFLPNDIIYYDQSHFIKEIKRYTSFTPQQLLQTPGLLSFRP